MRSRPSRPSAALVLVLACAALTGYFAWQTFFAYVVPDYRAQLTWEVPWISHPTPGLNRVYFRKKFSLTAEPAHASLAVIAPDSAQVWVNGHAIRLDDYIPGYTQVVLDVTPYLKVGTNVVAMVNQISAYPQVARVAVQGRYVLWSGETFAFGSSAGWKTSPHDRSLTAQGGLVTPTPWYMPDYDDGPWDYAVERGLPAETVTSPLPEPPAVLTTPMRGPWLWGPRPDGREAYLRTVVDLPERPRSAWVRIAAKRNVRLLINGYPIKIRESAFGTAGIGLSRLRSYDVTPYLGPGRNVLALQASSDRADHGLLVDGFVDGRDGVRTWLGPERWKAAAAPSPGWETATFDDGAWSAPTVVGPVTPRDRWIVVNQVDDPDEPLTFRLRAILIAVAVFGAAALGCLALWAGTAWVLSAVTGEPRPAVRRWLGVTFVPASLAYGIVVFVGYDARLSTAFPYQPAVVLGVTGGLVVLHLLLIAVVALAPARPRAASPAPGARPSGAGRRLRVVMTALVLLGLVTGGFFIRLKDVTFESLIVDELTGMTWTIGVLRSGYPSMTVDNRWRPATTSELVYFLKAITVGLFGANEFGLRFHDVVFGTATIPLFYWAGRLMHGRRVGLLAAAIYAILPSVIGMTHYGRYPSQQQFLSLLTIGLLFRSFQDEEITPWRYYLAAVAFVGTYLSWEGAAFLLPALTFGMMAMMRPRFDWMRNKHIWISIAFVASMIFFQLCQRFLLQAQWLYFGIGAQEASPALTFLYPFYSPLFYLYNFFTLQTHHVLTLAFLLSAPLWFLRSRNGRVMAFLAMSLLSGVAMITNLLDLHHWRYSYYFFPLLVLAAPMAVVVFFDFLASFRPPGAAAWVMTGLRRTTAVVAVASVLGFVTTIFGAKLFNLPLMAAPLHTRLGVRSWAEFAAAGEYVKRHYQDGDIVIAGKPSVMYFYSGRLDYYMQSEMLRPLLLGSYPGSAIHRTTGIPTIVSAGELREILARAPRVWYVTSNGDLGKIVNEDISATVRANMRTVYEDMNSVVYVSWPGRRS